ncbi:MAG TPA: phage tail protein [Burkholderiales bacterium]|nr:phage tail protein [Burkholderiales bacterium]
MAAGGLATTFNFRITLNRSDGSSRPLGDGGFQECTGLDIEMDVQELIEGGRNDSTVRLVGRGKFSNIVLKRGMLFPDDGTVNSELWGWLQGILSGVRPVARYNGIIEVLSPDRNDTVATWTFDRGLPSKIAGPQLNAKTGEIAIEELTIAHEGLRLQI